VPYTATKHAVTGLTKCIALDGRKHDIACGQLDVGNADTALGGRMKAGVPQASGEVKPEPVMDVAHCGSAIRYMASLPLDVNAVHEHQGDQDAVRRARLRMVPTLWV
jgi:NAD(P)-dependent dehydrogenase (short-subunit alcohol dehydrogenase family)